MDWRKLTKILAEDGWTEEPGRKHRKLRHPQCGLLVVPRSSSDHRAALNARAEVRRLYRRAGVALPERLGGGT